MSATYSLLFIANTMASNSVSTVLSWMPLLNGYSLAAIYSSLEIVHDDSSASNVCSMGRRCIAQLARPGAPNFSVPAPPKLAGNHTLDAGPRSIYAIFCTTMLLPKSPIMRPSDSKVVITSEAIVRLALSNREDEDHGRRDAFTFNYWESPLAVGVSFRHLHDSHSPVTDNLLLPELCARLQPVRNVHHSISRRA